jgi:hypothetical protein
MKQLQNIIAPLLLLGLVPSSMSSGTSEQKEVISVHSFAKYGANSSASLFLFVLFIIICTIICVLILKGCCHVKSNL